MNSVVANHAPAMQEPLNTGRDRLAWIFAAVLPVGIFFGSLPGYLLNYRQGLHSAGGATTLHVLAVLFSILAFLISFSLALLRFRRRWEGHMTVFFSRMRLPLPRALFSELTERERQVLSLLTRHYTNARIADELSLTSKMVRNYVSAILSKLQAADRAEAGEKVRQAGIE